MKIIKNRKIFLTISGLMFLIGLFALIFWGLRLGIEFRGGSLLELAFPIKKLSDQDLKLIFQKQGVGDVVIQSSDQSVIFRTTALSEETHQLILLDINKIAPDAKELRFDSIGPAIGKELKQKAILATIIAIFGILIYIAFAFRRVSRPVSSFYYGLNAVLAMIHDVVITLGVFAFLGHFAGVEVGLPFVAAILTVMGYSVHDTIVVFDRTRENLTKAKLNQPFEDIVEMSVNQTLVRSINTSLTVVLTLLALFFLGGEAIKYFVLALLVGIIIGTYSSIFVASPLLVFWAIRKKN